MHVKRRSGGYWFGSVTRSLTVAPPVRVVHVHSAAFTNDPFIEVSIGKYDLALSGGGELAAQGKLCVEFMDSSDYSAATAYGFIRAATYDVDLRWERRSGSGARSRWVSSSSGFARYFSRVNL